MSGLDGDVVVQEQEAFTGQQSGVAVRGWRESPYLDGATNIGAARDLLARSGDLALDLTLDIVPGHASREELHNLAADLEGMVHRLVSLRLRAGDLDAAKAFLGSFTTLPSMKSLLLEQPENQDRCPQRACVLPNELSLPVLDNVHLDAGYVITPGRPPLTTVRTLSLSPYTAPDSELSDALASFPHLVSLRINFSDLKWDAKPTAEPSLTRQLAASIQSVTLMSVPDRCMAWVLAAFHDPKRRNLAFDRCWCSFNADYRAILADLGKDIRVRIVVHGRPVVIVGTDARGLERSIDSVSDADFAPLFSPNYLNCDNIVEMMVLTDLLTRVVCTFANVALLVLIIGDLNFLDDKSMPPMPRFPGHALRNLTLLGDPEMYELDREDIADLVRALDLPLPLVTLNIDHRIFPGALGPFLWPVGSSHVGVFHV
ncbi:hypothetical protein AURDEDRAFT_165896 [Auricularia subglabra TFB-10046 SS5]|nr:hypothetical protein AURDEDRAFT_165896 [Auricularia subglabra TFB-10046 SS5]